ncbi:MAG: hypothetical protein ACTHZ9_04785 [Leucobacter sp.]
MALSHPGEEDDMTFIQTFGRTFGTKRVNVTPGAEAPGRNVEVFDGLVQPKSVDFNVDTPIYVGDQLTWDDPRGGQQHVYATHVDVLDAGSRNMRHISVKWAKTPPVPASPSGNGHVIVVNGSNVNIALEGSTITQQVPVAAGYEQLADAVGRALALIEATQGIDPDEVDAAREAATLVVEEAAKTEPDPRVLKKLLLPLRGVLTSAANSGAGAAASALITQLMT